MCWLFNVRGWGDVAYCPVVMSYALITAHKATLFIERAKLDAASLEALNEAGVTLEPYSTDVIKAAVARVRDAETSPVPPEGEGEGEGGDAAAGAAPSPSVTWLDPGSCCAALSDLFPPGRSLLRQSPLAVPKALKSAAEQAGMRAAHVRDGAAIVRWLTWLDGEMRTRFPGAGYFAETTADEEGEGGDAAAGPARPAKSPRLSLPPLTEVTSADRLEAERAKGDHFVGLSFPTISAVGANSATIHYDPAADATPTPLRPDAVFLCAPPRPLRLMPPLPPPPTRAFYSPHCLPPPSLPHLPLPFSCDSGGHYRDGTTDVTRTFHFGEPSDHVRKCTTLVLQARLLGSSNSCCL